MKICIVSDSHNHAELLAAVVKQAKLAGAQAVSIAETCVTYMCCNHF